MGQVVIFGGTADVNNTGVLEADTWTWNGSTWTNVTPPSPANSPSTREGASMAWDAATGQLVLFGGGSLNSNGDLVLNNDTWAWNGSTWTNVTPSAGNPPVRYGASMAFDAAQGLIVLFGGQGLNGVELDDTWTWNGSAWSNVTPASPVNSPSARDEAAMAYDAAAGQLVLFGGEPGDTSDTWIWNGTTWAQQSTSPVPGRAGAGMDYDAATAQLVMYSGESGSRVLGDVWTWNGTNWTEQTPVNNPPPSLAGAFAYDAPTGQLVLFGGEVPTDAQDPLPATTWTLQLGSESFSTANVCPGGTGPSPCNQSATLTFVFTAADSGISPSVVTQGATGLDFTDAGGGSCDINGTSHGYNIGDTCTVNVQFAPTLSHARNGGVVLKDATGIAGMAYVTGTGTGPQIAFTPPTISTLGGGFKGPEGVAVDGAGNVYVINLNPATVYEMPPNCTSSSCLTSLGDLSSRPLSVAVDGAGTLYAPGYDGGVLETPYGCTSCATTLGAGDFTALSGVTVDGAGNLYVADAGAGDVYEIPPGCTSLSCFISLGGGFDGPQGVAVDASGNVYVVDYGHNAVKEIPPGCTAAAYTVGSCTTTTLGGGFSGLNDLAVDGSGNVYVADTGNDAVKEIPPGCTSSSCVTTLASGFSDLVGVAVDGSGNVYVTNDAGVGSAPYNVTAVYKLSVSTPPTLTFPTATDVGVLDSTDGPLGFTVENIGNAPLSFAVPSSGSNPSVAAGFVWDDASSCTQVPASAAAFSLAPAGSCSVQIEFQPTAPGANMGSVALTDNSLNATAATQSAALSGTGQSPGTGTAISCAGCTPNPPYGTSLIFTAVVSPTAGSVTPTGSIGFSVDSGAPVAGTAASCPGGSAADSVCATFTTSTLTATSHTVEAIFTASGSFEGSNASTMVTVTPAPTKVLTTSPLTASAVDYKQTLASSTLSGGTVISSITGATVTGTWSFVNPLTTVLTVTGPQPVVFTPSAAVTATIGAYLTDLGDGHGHIRAHRQHDARARHHLDFGTVYLGQHRHQDGHHRRHRRRRHDHQQSPDRHRARAATPTSSSPSTSARSRWPPARAAP